ncbi:MAG: glycosyltransferase family 4 protein [Chloroflexi bacterium]|nr:glycosyltransferase family 4 protein [Chloroflexota bacterium]
MNTIAFVTMLQPETHYSRYLIGALQDCLRDRANLLIYADKDPRNQVLYPNVKLVWTPTLLFPFQIAGQVVKDRPSVVHLQHEINMYGGPSTAILFPLLLVLLWLVRTKTVVTVHSVVSPDQVDAEFMRTFSWRPSRLLIHSVRAFFSVLYRSIGWFCARVIVHSQYMANLLAAGYGVRLDKIVSIPIGVPEPSGVAPAFLGDETTWAAALRGKKFLLYFGYIIRRKGLEYLIDAFDSIHAEFGDYVLVLAGGELDYQKDYASHLRAEVKERALDGSIVFTSFISADQIQALFARCDFAVLPYTYSISSSLPLSFAMQYGKPVIATGLGTLEEEVQDHATGLLVPPRDAAALAAAMRTLLADEPLRRRLGESARDKGRQRSWLAVAGQSVQVYQSVQAVPAA